MKKKNYDDEQTSFDEHNYSKKIAELEKATQKIEADKEKKRLEREEKKFHKEQAKKRQNFERFIAPLLMLVTVLISFAIWLTHGK